MEEKLMNYDDKYVLKDSLVYYNGSWKDSGGSWDDKYGKYNSYAYAINRREQPQYYGSEYAIEYQPGNLSKSGKFDSSMSIDELATIVKSDLESIGYTSVLISNEMPANLTFEQKLICVRKCEYDYHFMRYDAITDAWYHKTMLGAVLKYKYQPSNDKKWSNEYSIYGMEIAGDIEYDSEIRYITYKEDVISANCLTNGDIYTKSVNLGKDITYRIDVECTKSYVFTSTALLPIQMTLYDEDMNLKEMSSTSKSVTTTIYLNKGTYYLRLNFESESDEGVITTTCRTSWTTIGYQVYYSDVTNRNDVLTHLHRTSDGIYKNKLYYYNTKGAGFYKFTIKGTKKDKTDVEYMSGSLVMYAEDNSTLMNKIPIDDKMVEAKTSFGVNSMYVYLPKNGYYYIDVNMTSNDLESLYLDITSPEKEEIDLVSNANEIEQNFSILTSQSTLGDYFKQIELLQTGKFDISLRYNSNDSKAEDAMFVLLKDDNNSNKVVMSVESMNSVEVTQTKTLEEGTYYVGVLDGEKGGYVDVTFERIINNQDSTSFVADPDQYTCGSQISVAERDIAINLRSYRATNILEGFTRLIYIENNNVPSTSRLDYNWYSTNNDAATVSSYGTVTALPVDKDTTVKITAIYKSDPSKVFTKSFTIIKDTETYDSKPIDIEVNMTMTASSQKSISFENVDVPVNYLQSYTWSSSNSKYASVDTWGSITTSASSSGQVVEIIGEYKSNTRVKIHINLTIN